MINLILKIEFLTPCLIGSGTGYSALIDTDIVFDDAGIPFIPAKRIKGCLRDSATEVCEYLDLAGIDLFNLKKESGEFSIVLKAFGRRGEDEPAGVYFSNLYIDNHESILRWIRFFIEEYSSFVTRESIINYFTELRQHTAIDKKTGTAKEHSLRTIRVAKKGLCFSGAIDVMEDEPEILKLLYLAAKNLRHMGTKRTKGFGSIRAALLEKDKELNFMDELEVLCKGQA